MNSNHARAEKLLGFSWTCSPEIFQLAPPQLERALWRMKKLFPEIIFDVVALEGNPFTFPQVQTLLDGITIGGQKVSDAEQILNQEAAFKKLISLCKSGAFQVTKQIACELNALIAKGEALQEGIFRTGPVSIAGIKKNPPAPEQLTFVFQQLLETQSILSNPLERAIATFLSCAKNHFFWDGNKRTGRLLMNGILLAAGQDIITVPAKCREEFNTKMVYFYETGEASEMFSFMAAQQITQRFEVSGNLPLAEN